MTQVDVEFVARRFKSTAVHYLPGRPAYPKDLIENTATLLDLGPQDRVLDLGAGPAQLAMDFAPLAGAVLALDPEPEMVAAGRAAACGLANVQVEQGGWEDLGPHLGRFRAVVIGRAFHWMDRAETLRRLDALVEPGGAVVLFGDGKSPVPEDGWSAQYRDLIKRYAEDDDTGYLRPTDDFAGHVAVLADSAFSRIDQVSVIRRHTFDLDRLVHRALSNSSTSRARLGPRADQMIFELTHMAAAWAPDGVFGEFLTSTALIARRP